jgi:hypothetical protein
MNAFISSGVIVPKRLLDMKAVTRAVTAKHFAMGSRTPLLVEGYVDLGDSILLPRQFGLNLIANLGIPAIDQMSPGVSKRFPREVKHTGQYAYQTDFVAQILAKTKERNDFMVHAATGKGKSVAALSVIQKRGRTALVLVDQNNLMDQWVSECKKILGLTDRQIGIVQGPVCDYVGKHVTVAMIQTLVSREYEDAFYEYFGTVVVDEVHTAGAPTFSKALLMFSAESRFGVSATVDRRDALQKLLQWNLGNVEVSLLDVHDKSYVYYVESDTVYTWYANISPKVGRMLTEVSSDGARNNTLVKIIEWLYGDAGRDILVVSDRIEQLESLFAMCAYAGIPESDMGIYTGFQNVWRFEKDHTPRRRPVGYEKGTDYTPITLTQFRRRIPKNKLLEIKNTKRILFATFGMFAKGVDVPRLSAGVDCTPRSRAQQVHGRILRVQEGKPIPIWVTMRDVNSYRLERQFAQRIDEYIASSAEVCEWNLEKGVRSLDAHALKREAMSRSKQLQTMNIETGVNGLSTLLTPSSRTGSKVRG